MHIPKTDTVKFARELANLCMSSRVDRVNAYTFFDNFAFMGSSDSATPALYNLTHASLDELESLFFSPVSLRFTISDPDIPNVVNEAKGRAAASRIRKYCRQTDTDSLISQAVGVALRKSMGIIKLTCNNKTFRPSLVQPDNFGVLHENHCKLDHDMEAFCHRMLITPSQFMRLVKGRPDEAVLKEKVKNRVRNETSEMKPAEGSAMNIVTGGLYPFRQPGEPANIARGVVDWMSQPKPLLDPAVESAMIEMDELYVWDDARDDWATLQVIGDDALIAGGLSINNAYSYNTTSMQTEECLKGEHPFNTFCVNPVPGYFWGFSEVMRMVFLQEAINARITGINRMLRKQEEPGTIFTGSTGVNQLALSRLNKPAGWYSELNANAKITRDETKIPADLWNSLHEYERMLKEVNGTPPGSKGQGDGIRSAQQADTAVRMFSPRFKDRALLVERDVEKLGASFMDLSRAHIPERLFCWVPKEAAGLEDSSTAGEEHVLIPPAPGLVPVMFSFADLPDDVTLMVDSHSSSPAFAADSKALVFDALKTGMMSPADAVDHLDLPDPDNLRAGITRRDVARSEAAAEEQKIKLMTHKGGKK